MEKKEFKRKFREIVKGWGEVEVYLTPNSFIVANSYLDDGLGINLYRNIGDDEVLTGYCLLKNIRKLN